MSEKTIEGSFDLMSLAVGEQLVLTTHNGHEVSIERTAQSKVLSDRDDLVQGFLVSTNSPALSLPSGEDSLRLVVRGIIEVGSRWSGVDFYPADESGHGISFHTSKVASAVVKTSILVAS